MGSYKKIITVSLYNRPEYTARTLGALYQCDGIKEYTVLFHCEPGFDHVRGFADKWPYAKEVFVNRYRLGCNQNIFGALNHGFRESNFVVMVEDDCVPAKEFLKFTEWCRDKYADNKKVFSCCGYHGWTGSRESERVNTRPEDYHKVQLEDYFCPWGWATWEDRFDEMRRGWGIGTYDSWDLVVNKIRGKRYQAVPLLDRIQNIGAEQGEHCPSAQWHRDNQFNEFWASSPAVLTTIDNAPFTEV